MSEKKMVTKVAALAGLAATVGIVGPADAAVGSIQAKLDQLRAAKDNLQGAILNSVAIAPTDRAIDYGQTYGQTYNETYNQTYNQSYTETIRGSFVDNFS